MWGWIHDKVLSQNSHQRYARKIRVDVIIVYIQFQLQQQFFLLSIVGEYILEFVYYPIIPIVSIRCTHSIHKFNFWVTLFLINFFFYPFFFFFKSSSVYKRHERRNPLRRRRSLGKRWALPKTHFFFVNSIMRGLEKVSNLVLNFFFYEFFFSKIVYKKIYQTSYCNRTCYWYNITV